MSEQISKNQEQNAELSEDRLDEVSAGGSIRQDDATHDIQLGPYVSGSGGGDCIPMESFSLSAEKSIVDPTSTMVGRDG